MSKRRKVFNKLHEEISLFKKENEPRWPLYQALQKEGLDPEDLSPKDAADWAREQGFLKVSRKIRRFDPNVETPEEIMERLTS